MPKVVANVYYPVFGVCVDIPDDHLVQKAQNGDRESVDEIRQMLLEQADDNLSAGPVRPVMRDCNVAQCNDFSYMLHQDPVKVVAAVKGGLVQGVRATLPPGELEFDVFDQDAPDSIVDTHGYGRDLSDEDMDSIWEEKISNEYPFGVY